MIEKLIYSIRKCIKPVKILIVGFFIGVDSFAICPIGNSQLVYSFENNDTLPCVICQNHTDLISLRLRQEAAKYFIMHQLPREKDTWETFRNTLKNIIIQKTGTITFHELPLDIKETGKINLNGYTVKNIYFQTRPGVYATANLYIPDGEGKFPAVIVMMGHSLEGRLSSEHIVLGQTLAMNGYVSLCIDPWGAGERSTIHGIYEDHGDGNNLGNALMNIGETLMGMQITDNIRGVDLLCSLPFVDSRKIGATGESGGGSQAMWLAAMDERVKATVPVVSAGTFESFVMGSPCICEVLPGGLTFTEEAGILALVAPRAIKMINHKNDSDPSFSPSEMLRSYNNARPIFNLYNAGENISYQVFDLRHGYFREDREAMLEWFDWHLKGIGTGSHVNETPFEILFPEQLMVFKKGERDSLVITTEKYCLLEGNELRNKFLDSDTIDVQSKRIELGNILGIRSKPTIKEIHEFPKIDGWQRFILESSDNKLIPLIVKVTSENPGMFRIICDATGKMNIPSVLIHDIAKSGENIAVIDLSGSGEVTSTTSSFDKRGNIRTLSRSLLWFEETLIGEWCKELGLTIDFLTNNYHTTSINIDGNREAGLAALFLGALGNDIESVVLYDAPVSYLFDTAKSINYFSMGIHIPGFMNWGDVSLAVALNNYPVTFINPVTMSGNIIDDEHLLKFKTECEKIKVICHQPGEKESNEKNEQ